MFDVGAHVWIINLQMDFMLDVEIMLMLCDISCQYYNIDGYQHFPHISSYLKHIKNHIMITLTRSDRKYWKIFIVWKVFHVSVSLLYDLSGVYFSPLRCLKIKKIIASFESVQFPTLCYIYCKPNIWFIFVTVIP